LAAIEHKHILARAPPHHRQQIMGLRLACGHSSMFDQIMIDKKPGG